MNEDRKKCFYSDSSIPAAATFFPMSAIVKYQNVKTIVAIPRV